MVPMISYLKARYLSEKAQGIVEYALLLAFVVGIAVVALSDTGTLATNVKAVFNDTANKVKVPGN